MEASTTAAHTVDVVRDGQAIEPLLGAVIASRESHQQQQQQQQQHTPASNPMANGQEEEEEDELEMTNCSETMSSADGEQEEVEEEEEQACDGAQRRACSTKPGGAELLLAGHSAIEQQRLQTGRNRLGTPRHEVAGGSGGGCVTNTTVATASGCGAARLSGAGESSQQDCDRMRSNDLILINNRANSSSGNAKDYGQPEQPSMATSLGQHEHEHEQQQQQQEHLLADSRQDESSEMSLASGQNQGPPSYGTATRSCATLDVGQLQQLHVQRLRAQQQQLASCGSNGASGWPIGRTGPSHQGSQINQAIVNNSNNNGYHHQQQTRSVNHYGNFELTTRPGQSGGGNQTTTSSLNYVSLGNLVAILNQQQQQQQCNHNNDQSKPSLSQQQQHKPRRPIDDSYGFLGPDKDQRCQQQQHWRQPARHIGLDLAAPSATLQRQVELAGTFAINGSAAASTGCSMVVGKKLDEGIYATLNVTQASNSHTSKTTTTTKTTTAAPNDSAQRLPPPLPLLPINHVISAQTSIQQQPPWTQQQQQQQQAITQPQANQSASAVAAARGVLSNSEEQATTEHLVDIYCPAAASSSTSVGGSGVRAGHQWANSLPSTDLLLAHRNTGPQHYHQFQHSATPSGQPQQQHNQKCRLDDGFLLLASTSSANGPAAPIGGNFRDDLASFSSAGQEQTNETTNDDPTRAAGSHQNNNCPPAASSSTPRSVKQRRHRRHKSTSGGICGMQAVGSSTSEGLAVQQRRNQDLNAQQLDARQARGMDQTSGQATISAHCWLIDSGDEQQQQREQQQRRFRSKKAGARSSLSGRTLPISNRQRTMPSANCDTLAQENRRRPMLKGKDRSMAATTTASVRSSQTLWPFGARAATSGRTKRPASSTTLATRSAGRRQRNRRVYQSTTTSLSLPNVASSEPDDDCDDDDDDEYDEEYDNNVEEDDDNGCGGDGGGFPGANGKASRRHRKRERRGPRSCYSNASAVVRLSAMLSFVSNLVGGGGTGAGSRSSVRSVGGERRRTAKSRAPSSSATKSGLLSGAGLSNRMTESNLCSSTSYARENAACSRPPSANHQHQGPSVHQYNVGSTNGAGAGSSLAYSSSTSAYVTGNSSLHSHDCGSSSIMLKPHSSSLMHTLDRTTSFIKSQHQQQQQQQQAKSIFMSPAGTATGPGYYHDQPAPSTLPNGNTSGIYNMTTSSNNKFNTAVSHHSYEYCDQDALGSSNSKPDFGHTGPNEHIELSTITQNQHQQQHQKELPSRVGGSQCRRGSSSVTSLDMGHEEQGGREDTCSESTCSPAQLVGLNQTGLVGGSLGDRSRLAQILMSDNELISATASSSNDNNNSRPLANRLAASLPAQPRRRWWWNSFKLWLLRGSTCQETRAKIVVGSGARGGGRVAANSTDDDDNASLTYNRPAGPPNANSALATSGGGVIASTVGCSSGRNEPATRYRSLKSSGAHKHHHHNAHRNNNYPNRRHQGARRSSPSTLANVISLAKIDRVFRCRLLASLLVSAILLVLICLLAVIILRRSSVLSSLYAGGLASGARFLSLGPATNRFTGPTPIGVPTDDLAAEYDMSWLWPQQQQQQQQQLHHQQQQQQQQISPEDIGGAPVGNGGDQRKSIDTNLRSLLHVIDRSERLEQFQTSLTHLSNLQLASDHFIDLTELAAEVMTAAVGQAESSGSSETDQIQSYAAASIPAASGQHNATSWPLNLNGGAPTNPSLQSNFKMDQNHLELFSLTLLSNLHWPLVKWRHQSQQATAASSFLSFAMPSAASRPSLLTSSSTGGASGLQTIRSLLSSLILVESLNPQVTASYANLKQFHRLHLSLRLVGYHLATCAMGQVDTSSGSSGASSSGDSSSSYADEARGQKFRWYRERFCMILIKRYNRMMLAMSQLSQQDLAELHQRRPIELQASVFAGATAAGGGGTKPEREPPGGGAAKKNLLGFLLDRLALLDPWTVAELSLTIGNDLSEETNSVPELLIDDELIRSSGSNYEQPINPTIEELSEADFEWRSGGASSSLVSLVDLLASNQEQIDTRTGNLLPIGSEAINSETIAQQQAKQDNIYELVKTFVGDTPIKRLISNKLDISSETNNKQDDSVTQLQHDWREQYLSEFARLRQQQDQKQWLDLLVYDLFTPWPSYRLPRFMRAHNYDLFLHPNLTTRLVLGMNKIEFELERPTSFLVLNCADLNLIDLSLWWQRPPLVVGTTSKQQQPSVNKAPTGASETHKQSAVQDRQVIIRRVLRLAQQEMLFIELEETLEPVASLRPAAAATASLEQVDFGEPPQSVGASFEERRVHMAPLQNTNQQRPLRAFVRNQFVLSVSFNKTSLMAPNNARSGQHQGLEFIRYTDYFGSTGSQHQQQPQQQGQTYRSGLAEGGDRASTVSQQQEEDDESTTRTLMFSTFNTLPSQSNANVKWWSDHDANARQARRLFPCLDEPQFRARWQLNMVHDSSSQALSNGQRRERLQYNSLGSLQMTIFEQTPVPLSPNLLAILVCDLNNIRSLTSRLSVPAELISSTRSPIDGPSAAASPTTARPSREHIQVQTWAQFEHLSQAELASQLVPQLLAFYQTHLNFVYPLDKLDLVALPDAGQHQPMGMVSGVTYNADNHYQHETSDGLGLMLLRGDHRPLVDVNLISQDLIESVSASVAHQLAHQFLGNIVEPQSGCRDRWLFEALAEYLESLALTQVQFEWRLDEQFPVSSLRETLINEQTSELAFSSQTMELSSGEEQPISVEQQRARSGPSWSELAKRRAGGRRRHLATHRETSSISSSRRGAAVVHMLMQTLLHTQESRARLLRSCLQTYQYSTMSSVQFWRLFNQQLIIESSPGRLSPILAGQEMTTDQRNRFAEPSSSQVTIYSADTSNGVDSDSSGSEISSSLAMPIETANTTAGNNNSTSNERVVFVNRRRTQGSSTAKQNDADNNRLRGTAQLGEDAHQVRASLATSERPADPLSGMANASRQRPSSGQHSPTSTRLVDRLGALANIWLNRRGFPLISASCYRDSLQLRQDQFRFAAKWMGGDDAGSVPAGGGPASRRRKRRQIMPNSAQQEPTQEAWPIPLMFISRLSPKLARFVWFDKHEMELLLDGRGGGVGSDSATGDAGVPSTNYSTVLHTHMQSNSYGISQVASLISSKLPQQYSWFKLNHNGTSLVRVNYDERNWEALISLLTRAHYSNHILNQLDRANLLDDAMTLMRYGQLSVNLAMNLTLYLELGERDYQPWQTILVHLDQLQTLLNQNPLWHQYVLKLIQPISIVVGWKDDGPHLMRKLRRELYQLAIQYGDDKILAKARQEFKNWMLKAGQFIVPNLQELVYVAGVRYGDQQEWFHCWQKYQQLVALSATSQASPLETGTGLGSGGGGGIGSSVNTAGNNAQADQYGTTAGASVVNANSVKLSNLQLLQAAARSSQGANSLRRSAQSTGGESSSMMMMMNGSPLVAFNMAGESSAGAGSGGGSGLGTTSLIENEKRQLLTALASTQNTWLLEQFLNFTLDSSKIQAHHLHHVVRTLGKNPVARLYLWRFVRLNWLELMDRFGVGSWDSQNNNNGSDWDDDDDVNSADKSIGQPPISQLATDDRASYSILETMILESTKHFATKLDYEEVSAFFEAKSKQQSIRRWPSTMRGAIRESLATIRANIHWRNSIEPKLTRWLSHYNSIT